ncbi:hypothetical protein ACFV3R_27035 [Streptomyces sp. NPDC059740]|uniref:MmyB family transcriptional regulator n=1 Tax=Streptomyces sp. NPDC059740 TaxID=3346926 RepID=UPI0036474201
MHLFALAHQALPERGAEPPAGAVRRMLDMLAPPTAAYVIDRNSDVLAWNSTAAALFPHLVPGSCRPNNLLFVFTDPGAAELFVDWPDIAADSVAHLRAAAGHRPHDVRLDALLRRLRAHSARFGELWEARDLRQKVEGRKELRHPLVGRMSLDYAVLAAPTAPGQRLVACSADPGSPSYEALLTLGRAPVAPGVSAL